MKLTQAQQRVLVALAEINDAGKAANNRTLRARIDVLERMRTAGLIDSASPFAYAFHTVTITPAGRAALKDQRK